MALITITKGGESFISADEKDLFVHCTGRSMIKEDELSRYETVLKAHGISCDIKASIGVVSVETETTVELVDVIDEPEETEDGEAAE